MPGTQTKTYDPAGISIAIGGALITGFEPGTFLTLTRNANNFDTTLGPDGQELIRTKRNDRSALLTLTLRQTSPSNLVLANFANRDEVSGDGVAAISITDEKSGAAPEDVNFSSGKCWVEKPSDAVYAETPQGRPWQIRLAEVPMNHAGIPATAVLTEAL